MISDLIRPFQARLRRLAGLAPVEFLDGAAERWQVSPGETFIRRPALALPGQLERVRGTEFGPMTEIVWALVHEKVAAEDPTWAWRLRDVDLVDGVLYHRGGEYHLRPRQRRFGLRRPPRPEISGALYETWTTNRWFGSWLMEACVTYDLALAEGRPLTTATAPPSGSHQARYEELAGMAPQRIAGDAHFTELVIFDDYANNGGKARRADALRRRLTEGREIAPVPGVFLLRGDAGDRRLLLNEDELAESLATERGFLVIDPLAVSVDELIDACAGARFIVGVEGSQLVHGITVAPRDAAIIPIQPPERVVATLKHQADRLDQRFGLLVAEGSDTEFRLDRRDLLATLDLFD